MHLLNFLHCEIFRRIEPHDHALFLYLGFCGQKGRPMTKILIQTNAANVEIPLKFYDRIGEAIAVPVDLAVTSSDENLGTVIVSGNKVEITRVGSAGSFNVVATSGGVSATLEVDIVEPSLAGIGFDVANAVYAKPAPVETPLA